jgi:hypothetical protein
LSERDVIEIILREILNIEKELILCDAEYHGTLVAKRDMCCRIMQLITHNDKEKIEIAAGILGDLHAGEVGQEISQITGVNYVR